MARINTNMASEFWFFSQLHRLGYEAYITLGNTKAIDIVVILKDKKRTRLTFDVKGKESFNQGTYQHLDRRVKPNHFYVFVGLQVKKNNNSKKIELCDPIECYLVESKDVHLFAHDWQAKGKYDVHFGMEQNYLKYIHSKGKTKITKRALDYNFKMHNIKELDFNNYKNKVMTIQEFEARFYRFK